MRGPYGVARALDRGAVDPLLYAGSAVFAAHALRSSTHVDYRTWAAFAWPAYTAGAVGGVVLVGCAVRLGRRLVRARVLLAAAVIAGALVAPLATEIARRGQGGSRFVASEVILTEGAAAEFLAGRDPYAAHFGSTELAGGTPSIAEHFPYLPGMALFGLPRALLPRTPWTDARIVFTLVTALATAAALALWRAPAAARLLALQVLVVLPTGAALLVIGGDDVAVLALCLLGLVLAQRGSRGASLAAVAAAACLKLTAWPVLLALALADPAAGRDPAARARLTLAAAFVGLVVMLPAAAHPARFAEDVFVFPVGLTALPSPATTGTVGSAVLGMVGGASPQAHVRAVVSTLLLGVALLVGAAALLAVVRSRGPRTRPAAVAALGAAAVLVALILLAPVGRSGYFVYPLDLAVWGVLLREA